MGQRTLINGGPVSRGQVSDAVIASVASGLRLSETTTATVYFAEPVPGSDAGPWLRGSQSDLVLWKSVFGAGKTSYRARKGITTDRNGIYWVRVDGIDNGVATVTNEPSAGRTKGVARRTGQVEAEHVFPLLRGRGVSRFQAKTDEDLQVLVPQRGMHGDPDLPANSPGMHKFLSAFRSHLEARGSYRRDQRGQPYWSLWSTGPYTFSPYKGCLEGDEWREVHRRPGWPG